MIKSQLQVASRTSWLSKIGRLALSHIFCFGTFDSIWILWFNFFPRIFLLGSRRTEVSALILWFPFGLAVQLATYDSSWKTSHKANLRPVTEVEVGSGTASTGLLCSSLCGSACLTRLPSALHGQSYYFSFLFTLDRHTMTSFTI
jgi:hypothetical protein